MANAYNEQWRGSMNTRYNRGVALLGAGLCWALLSNQAASADLNLSDSPLVVSGAVDPNIMLLLDTSGSMSNIVPDSPFSAATDYVNCTGGNRLAADSAEQVEIRVQSDGDVYFSYDGSSYDFGNGSGSGITGRTQKCFYDDSSYNARLSGNGSSGGERVPSGYLQAEYTGNFLNWYLSNNTYSGGANFGAGAVQRPGTNTRMEVAKAAGASLVTGLNDVRLGMASYHGSNGATIQNGIEDIAVNRSAVSTSITNLSNSGSTPLGEAFAAIGRYFLQGFESNTLTLHPGETNEATAVASDIFGPPSYASGVTVPTNSVANRVIQYQCQKNFIVALTDGRPQSDRDISSYLQDYDGDCDGASPACLSYDRKAASEGYEYESSGSDYLDDVAGALYDIDLRPNLNDSSGSPVKNNVTSYMIGFADDQAVNDPLMRDTASNGGGEFLVARTSSALSNVFNSVFASIFSQVGSVASVAFNSSQLSSDSAVFQAKFDSARWNGSLQAFPLSDTGVIEAEAWDAADKLDALALADRNVFTYNEDTNEGAEFTLATISAAQKADLWAGQDSDDDGDTSNDDEDAQLLLEYLLGDRSNEGTDAIEFRVRTSRLGDIVNSTPVFVGAPELNWPDYDSAASVKFGSSSKNYSDFKEGAAESRTKMLYVGANDGMLHGFNGAVSGTGAGDELFAYIPGMLASSNNNSGLHYLASQNYDHKFYVDATPAVSDVFIDSGAGSDWLTVLIGGLRAGGQGYYALDITDPDRFSDPANNADEVVLWEFTSTDDANLGNTYGTPTIVKMANGKWAAVFGNGYNNTGDGHAELFIVFIEAGIDGTWTYTGTPNTDDYVRIDTGVGSSTTPNGLSTIRIADVDGDSVADRIYGGDLLGNMWVFDVTSSSPASWGSVYTASGAAAPLFTAENVSGEVQPITTAPLLAKNKNIVTSVSNAPNFLVLFGTGKYLEASDVSSNSSIQSYYAVSDAQAGSLTRSNLERREVLTTVTGLRTVTGDPIDWAVEKGWFLDLENQLTGSEPPALGAAVGERVVSESLLRRTILFFNTAIPSDVECESGGTGWLMSLQYDTGLAPSFAVFDTTNNGIDSSDLGYVGRYFADGLPAKSGILGDKQYTPSSDGSILDRDIYVGLGNKEGRLSWQELIR